MTSAFWLKPKSIWRRVRHDSHCYDPAADAFYARFAPQGLTIADTREVAPGVMVDFDASGDVVGIEVLSVSNVVRMRRAPRARGRAMSVELSDAMGRYWARFRTTPPFTLKMPTDHIPRLIAAMDAAVERGRPMTAAEVVGLAGMTLPEGWDGPLPPGIMPPLL